MVKAHTWGTPNFSLFLTAIEFQTRVYPPDSKLPNTPPLF